VIQFVASSFLACSWGLPNWLWSGKVTPFAPGLRSDASLPSPPGAQAGCAMWAIDIGTNSIHLLIAAVDPGCAVFALFKAEQIQCTALGERDPDHGPVTPAAIERALLAWAITRAGRQPWRRADSHREPSAVRRGAHGREFCRWCRTATALEVGFWSAGPEEPG